MCTVKKALSSSAPSNVVTMSPADTSGRMCCFNVLHTQASSADNLSSGQRIAASQPAMEDSADVVCCTLWCSLQRETLLILSDLDAGAVAHPAAAPQLPVCEAST